MAVIFSALCKYLWRSIWIRYGRSNIRLDSRQADKSSLILQIIN